jgi:hypothetical protein
MQEPAYVSPNGTPPVPYIPHTITTSRQAYAASLHVIFKHVADFHICVVQAISAKYGMPEDDILKTIQESDEFKNMHVDQVLVDALGYLPVPEPPAPEPAVKPTEEVAKKTSIPAKTKKVKPATIEPVVVVVEEEERRNPEPEEPIKPKVIRKRVVQKPAPAPVPAPAPAPAPSTAVNLYMDESCTNVIAANTEGTLEAQVATNATSLAPPINVKTINKKVIKKSGDVPVVVAPATNAAAPATNAVAPATNAAANDAPRKIIKKKRM